MSISFLFSTVIVGCWVVFDFSKLSVQVQVDVELCNAMWLTIPNIDLQLLDVSFPEECLAEEVLSMLHQFVDGIYVLRSSSVILVTFRLAEAKHFNQTGVSESN